MGSVCCKDDDPSPQPSSATTGPPTTTGATNSGKPGPPPASSSTTTAGKPMQSTDMNGKSQTGRTVTPGAGGVDVDNVDIAIAPDNTTSPPKAQTLQPPVRDFVPHSAPLSHSNAPDKAPPPNLTLNSNNKNNRTHSPSPPPPQTSASPTVKTVPSGIGATAQTHPSSPSAANATIGETTVSGISSTASPLPQSSFPAPQPNATSSISAQAKSLGLTLPPGAQPINLDQPVTREDIEAELNLSSLPIIDEAEAIEQCGTYEFMGEIMEQFKIQYNRQKSVVAEFLDKEDWAQFASESHSLKGAAANLFIMRIKKLCLACEMVGKNCVVRLNQGGEVPPTVKVRGQILLQMLEEAFQDFEVRLVTLVQSALANQ